ncbi:hypothetical protein PMAYCL1PPCAC_04746, partial [Pristionchus mayeri]
CGRWSCMFTVSIISSSGVASCSSCIKQSSDGLCVIPTRAAAPLNDATGVRPAVVPNFLCSDRLKIENRRTDRY